MVEQVGGMSRGLGRSRVVALTLAIKVAGLRQTAENNGIVTSSLLCSCIAIVESWRLLYSYRLRYYSI